MGAGIRKYNRGLLLSYLSPAPSPLQEHSGCAKLSSTLGWLPRAPSAQTPLPLQYMGVPCWEGTAGAKSWGACPNALLGDVPLPHDPAALLLKAIDLFSGGNAEMPATEQKHSISGSVSAYLSGSTWLHCIAWASERAWDFLAHRQQTSNTAVGCFLRNNASANIPRSAFGKTNSSRKQIITCFYCLHCSVPGLPWSGLNLLIWKT